jgi:hypothetical protein
MITLETHACPRCGLAVRPTCSNCGEALEVRMHACPRCWEVIEQPASFAEGAVLYDTRAPELPQLQQVGEPAAAYATTTLTQEAPVYVQQPYHRPRTQIRLGRLILIGLVAGIVLTAGLIALEAVGPRLRGSLPDQVTLEREGFPDLEFAIAVPDGWDVRTERIGGRPAVRFLEPGGSGGDSRLREFHVVVEEDSFDRARELADRRAPPSTANYDEIAIVDGLRIDGRRTFRHTYTDDDEYREAWWVERGGGTYRIEFVGSVSRREESAQLNVRIARTFDVL